jgi:hypothetical protein
MSGRCSSPLVDVVKTGGGEGEEGIGIPAGVCARVCAREDASDITCTSVIVCVVVDLLLVS